jgi:cobalt-zinc-cadmium efflux system protein
MWSVATLALDFRCIIASSLALISDAGHMLTDAAAIALALIAARLATRPAAGNLTCGWKRVEILSAQANGITLWLLAAWFVYEGVRRLIHPPEVAGGLVLGTALVGIVVNVVASWLIGRADRTSLNVEGAFQHILNDLFAFIATAVAGLIILLTGWTRADAIAALIVAALMAKAGWDSSGSPGGSSSKPLPAASTSPPSMPISTQSTAYATCTTSTSGKSTSGFPALSAHILVDRSHDCHERQHAITDLLQERYGIDHTTLQVDHPSVTIVSTEDLGRRLHGTVDPATSQEHDH